MTDQLEHDQIEINYLRSQFSELQEELADLTEQLQNINEKKQHLSIRKSFCDLSSRILFEQFENQCLQSKKNLEEKFLSAKRNLFANKT